MLAITIRRIFNRNNFNSFRIKFVHIWQLSNKNSIFYCFRTSIQCNYSSRFTVATWYLELSKISNYCIYYIHYNRSFYKFQNTKLSWADSCSFILSNQFSFSYGNHYLNFLVWAFPRSKWCSFTNIIHFGINFRQLFQHKI